MFWNNLIPPVMNLLDFLFRYLPKTHTSSVICVQVNTDNKKMIYTNGDFDGFRRNFINPSLTKESIQDYTELLFKSY